MPEKKVYPIRIYIKIGNIFQLTMFLDLIKNKTTTKTILSTIPILSMYDFLQENVELKIFLEVF